MGAAGMRSALLPTVAKLSAESLRFLLRVAPLPGFRRPYAFFDAYGGGLSSGRRGVVLKKGIGALITTDATSHYETNNQPELSL